MNKKGFTTIELIVSFTLTTIIVVFLFQLIFILKDLYVSFGIKLKLVTKQSTINSMINDDFVSKRVNVAFKDSDTSVTFYFEDGSSKKLSYDKSNKIVSYGDYTTKLVSGSEFGNIKISTEVNVRVDDYETLNGVLNISIPIYHSLIEKEDFGIKIMYLYNSNSTSLGGLNITDIVDAEKQIFLVNSEAVAFENIAFTDPGYYVLNKQTEEVVQNDPSVKVSGTVNTNVPGTYYLTYTIYDMNGNVMDEEVRTVNVIKSEYVFSYTGNKQQFNVPVNGVYKIETWGASGGGTNLMSGKGGYSVGQFSLQADNQLFIYVGGEGSLSTVGSAALGGFNGGGASGSSNENFAGSGGGATDVRLNNDSYDSRFIVAGGGGGAGSRNDDVTVCTGGTGGGTSGGVGTCSAESYLGGAGTQTVGGSAATYETNITSLPTAGSIGIAGNGASYSDGTVTYASGGGGGGYYGGGGGSRYGGGGGGSGYCSGNDCNTYSGTESFSKIDSSGYENGHTGNGYVKITLISIN